MEINPINSKRIYQSIIEQFIQLIKDNKIRVNEKLPPERTLAEMFNVSRATLREAFSAMEVIGLIEVRPGEGSFVREFDIAPFINTIAPLFIETRNLEEELLELRRLLEMEAVEIAATQLTREAGVLTPSLEKMAAAVAQDDYNSGAEADIAFHKGIFELTGNFILIKASECISSMLELSVRFNRAKILKKSENSQKLYTQHLQIYEAIHRHQVELAKELMQKHLHFVKEIS